MFGKIVFAVSVVLSIVFLVLGLTEAIVEFIVIGCLGFIASGLVFKQMKISFKQNDD